MQRVPNIKQVVIVQNWLTPWWWDDQKPIPYPLQMLLQACPQGIQVAALILEEKPFVKTTTPPLPSQQWQRSLYQPAAGGGWVQCHEIWYDTTVLAPPKQFNGPVGKYQKLAYEFEKVSYQEHALWPLQIEALDRHHFDDKRNMPFTCPLPGCNTYIARAGEWSVHAAECHSGEWLKGSLTAALPEPLALTFKSRIEALRAIKDNIYRQHDKLYEHWQTLGEQKREEILQTWIDQLNNDPAWDTGEKAEESRLYTQFLQNIYAEGSSTH
jgi:hypothetical protein